jgi:hypothetical protein
LPPSTTKRVVLYRWDRQPSEGIVNPSGYLLDDRIEWITPDGRLQFCLLEDCKALCFVSENGKADLFTEHNLFERRPRVPGLWTRFSFRDGGILDGILAHNLLEWPISGYFIVPPQARANRQRVFIPRVALVGTELRGVVGGSGLSARKNEKFKRVTPARQLTIFDL